MIIDVHAHLGVDRVFDEVRSEDEIIEQMDANRVDATIVQNMVGTIDMECIREDHDRIYNFSLKYPKRIFGMVSMNPHIKEQNYIDEAARCVNELGFAGIKLHAFAHACNPLSKDGKLVWEVASKLGVPIMVHTGPGIPFALPSLVIPRAKEYPDVKVVLAHSGLVIAAGEAMVAAKECPNVYLETSWSTLHHIEHFIHDFGANRVMFASDEVTNLPVELCKYRNMHISEQDREYCLSKTAIEVFKLPF